MMPRLAAALSALMLLAGCAAAVPPPSLYLLRTLPPAGEVAPAPAGAVPPVAVVLAPVAVPDYLDRTEIVRRAGDSRVAMAEDERWAEPLRAGLQRVLTADLADRLGGAYWVTGTAGRRGSGELEVVVEIERFEPDAEGHAILAATWEVKPADRDRQPLRGRSRYQGRARVGETAELVQALSANLAELAAELAGAVKEAVRLTPAEPERRLGQGSMRRSEHGRVAN
jgi:uncharacterized lipoprotein YmbA